LVVEADFFVHLMDCQFPLNLVYPFSSNLIVQIQTIFFAEL
jgi:hypothetical protein